jgi:FHS family L-fucose permease-like MFS transporter
MIGRFAGSASMKFVQPPRLLALFAAGAVVAGVISVLSSGGAAVWMIVLLGFFHSIMFPTIFALSLDGVGAHRKLGASLLVMSIVGGAIIPALMGWISDLTTIQTAFIVPIVCYAYVAYFAVLGHRHPATVTAGQP